MKKSALLIFIPVIIGIALIVVGSVISVYEVRIAGVIVLFGGSFVAAVIMTCLIVFKVVKGDSDEKKENTRENENAQIQKINSTYGVENKIAVAEHQITQVKSANQNAPKSKKALGCVMVIVFIAFAVCGVILMALGQLIAGGVMFGAAFLTIIISLIVVKAKENKSLSLKYDPADYEHKLGKVASCSVSSSVSTGSHSTRVVSVVYLVMLDIDGKQYEAYSREYFDTDETLRVLVKKNGKTVKILGSMQRERICDDDCERSPDLDDETTDAPTAYAEQRFANDSDFVESRSEYVSDEESGGSVWDDVMAQYIAEKTGATRVDSSDESETVDGNETVGYVEAAVSERADDIESKSDGEIAPEPEHDHTPADFAHTHEKPSAARSNRPNVGYKGIKRK